MTNVQAVKQALLKVFAHYGVTKKMLDGCVFSGKNDPGQNSPSAPVIVGCETGVPNPSNYDVKVMELWYEVNDLLVEMGHPLYHEPVNGGVVAFYKC
jgi:hypothetical protein